MIIAVAVAVIVSGITTTTTTTITIKFAGSSYHQDTLSAQQRLLRAAPRQSIAHGALCSR